MKAVSPLDPSARGTLERERPKDGSEVEQLLDLCFGGAARLSRPIYNLRRGLPSIGSLCFVLRGEEGKLAAVLRFWSVRVRSRERRKAGSKSKPKSESLLLFGPLAVDPSLQGQGFGKRLTSHGLSAARDFGTGGIVISCVPAYYRPFGFRESCVHGLEMPRPSPGHAAMGLELKPHFLYSLKGRVEPETTP